MPEGDTVWQTAARLHRALAGGLVTTFDIRVPGSATADLTGERVREVVPTGKHLLARIGDSTLHSHLRMEGRWDVLRPGEPWRVPAFRVRAVVATEKAVAVGSDLAMVEVLRTRDESTVVGHLGPDPLAPGWDASEAVRRLSADPRAIHVALLDQRNLAGLGNEYVNEVLFVRGIRPTTPAAEVDLPGLVDTAARMIRANRDRPVRTFTGDTRRGQENWVYRRGGRPCRRCGSIIEESTLGAAETAQRIVFRCPRCQP